MMDKINMWIDNNREKNNAGISLLKFFYAIGRIEVVHSIIVTILSIIIPMVFTESWKWGMILLVLLVVWIFFNCVCGQYQKRSFIQRKFAAEVLDNQSSLMSSIIIEIQSNPQWRMTIFKKTSELVCEKIRSVFKDILKCNSRVSIEYVFDKEKNGKAEKHLKMAGRRSPNRDTCKGAQPFEKRNKYFSYKIFRDNKQGINVLPKEKVHDASLWYANPVHTVDVKQYIGIAISIKGEQVDFILQIDCLDDIVFGKNNTDDEIKEFINQYLSSYINIVSFSYLMNLNKYRRIPEV